MSATPLFTPPDPPPDRGRWLTVDDVRALLGNQVSRDWVCRNVPHKLKVGHRTVGWFLHDVLRWLESKRCP
jgi:predicted DNA-binding transcriptional regulator AlpA